ncbi:MAG: M15 family metallopeptidase [Actinomycetota bacterium]
MRFDLWSRPGEGSGATKTPGGGPGGGHFSRLGSAALIATATFLLTAGLPLAQAQDPELSEPLAPAIRINFQPEGSEPVCGFSPDYGAVFGARDGLGYGWNQDHTDVTVAREPSEDRRLDTLTQVRAGGSWEIELANGEHDVRVSIGDAAEASTHTLNVEGTPFFDATRLDAGQFQEVARTVTVTDGKLTLDGGPAPEGATRINYLEIDASGAPEHCDEPGDTENPKPRPARPAGSASITGPVTQVSSTALTTPINVNFQPKGSPEACGYTPDRGRVFADRHDLSFGWSSDHLDRARDRGVRKDQRKDSLIRFGAGDSWAIALPAGEHLVKIGVGDAVYGSVNTVEVEGVSFFERVSLEANHFATLTRTVLVEDGYLTVSGAANNRRTRLNFIDINSPGPRLCKDGPISGEATVLPPRPYGREGLKDVFGRHCNSQANDGRAYFPSAGGRGSYGYVYFHSRLSHVIGRKILRKINTRAKANDYGVWGYACRMKTGGTSWSVHSWGAAIDTNTLRNPYGQRHWNGRGSNGKPFGKFLPNIWMDRGFYWGLNFNDPMHFQYVSGY